MSTDGEGRRSYQATPLVQDLQEIMVTTWKSKVKWTQQNIEIYMNIKKLKSLIFDVCVKQYKN